MHSSSSPSLKRRDAASSRTSLKLPRDPSKAVDVRGSADGVLGAVTRGRTAWDHPCSRTQLKNGNGYRNSDAGMINAHYGGVCRHRSKRCGHVDDRNGKRTTT